MKKRLILLLLLSFPLLLVGCVLGGVEPQAEKIEEILSADELELFKLVAQKVDAQAISKDTVKYSVTLYDLLPFSSDERFTSREEVLMQALDQAKTTSITTNIEYEKQGEQWVYLKDDKELITYLDQVNNHISKLAGSNAIPDKNDQTMVLQQKLKDSLGEFIDFQAGDFDHDDYYETIALAKDGFYYLSEKSSLQKLPFSEKTLSKNVQLLSMDDSLVVLSQIPSKNSNLTFEALVISKDRIGKLQIIEGLPTSIGNNLMVTSTHQLKRAIDSTAVAASFTLDDIRSYRQNTLSDRYWIIENLEIKELAGTPVTKQSFIDSTQSKDILDTLKSKNLEIMSIIYRGKSIYQINCVSIGENTFVPYHISLYLDDPATRKVFSLREDNFSIEDLQMQTLKDHLLENIAFYEKEETYQEELPSTLVVYKRGDELTRMSYLLCAYEDTGDVYDSILSSVALQGSGIDLKHIEEDSKSLGLPLERKTLEDYLAGSSHYQKEGDLLKPVSTELNFTILPLDKDYFIYKENEVVIPLVDKYHANLLLKTLKKTSSGYSLKE